MKKWYFFPLKLCGELKYFFLEMNEVNVVFKLKNDNIHGVVTTKRQHFKVDFSVIFLKCCKNNNNFNILWKNVNVFCHYMYEENPWE